MSRFRWIYTGSILCFCLSLFAADPSSITVTSLRCEYRTNPIGIDTVYPRLSWVLNSPERAQTQTAYQIIVASSPDLLDQNRGDWWDTGKVASNQSIQISYNGRGLSSHDACYWKVRIWDQNDQSSSWSAPAVWRMGLLQDSDWKAQWIGLDQEEPKEEASANPLQQANWIWYPEANMASIPVGTRYFRRTFELPEAAIRTARLWISADNSFRVWINGEQAGHGSNYHEMTEIDLTSLLRPGQNCIAVQAGNVGDSPNPAGLIAHLRCDVQEADPILLDSDASWKSSNQEAAEWSSPAFDDRAWPGSHIVTPYGGQPWGNAPAPADDCRLPARYLRKEFTLPSPLKQAIVSISGLGLFELQINGKKVGDHVLEPGLTEYDKRVFYETFDVLPYLQPGENALGVILGNGRFYAPRREQPMFTKTYGFPKLLLQLDLLFEDGSIRTITSGPDWKITKDGPIRANNEYDGEEYDARLEMPGWSCPGFNDSAWQAVERVKEPKGKLRAQMMEPIRVTETLRPIALSNPKPGMYIYDMGQNMVGWCRLKVQGPRGTQVTLRHAELLKPDGTLYLDNIRSAKVTDRYTLSGEGIESYEPRFTYHGFRYVELTGYPGTPNLGTLEGRVVHDDVPVTGSFETSNALLNQIYQNITWGTRGNYRSFPTDCPQRDERQAWLGDRAAEARGETYLFQIAPLYAKWMRDIFDSQDYRGSVPSVAPPYWPIYPDDVTWPSAYIIIPGMLHDQYGELSVLEECYPSMKRWMEFMNGFLQDGIMPQDTYGDWCVPPESPELIHSTDPSRITAKAVLGTTYHYNNLCLMARYATLLGREDDATGFRALAEQVNTAFQKKFFDPINNRYDNGTDTSYVLPLSFGMVPEEHRAAVFANLAKKIVEEHKGHIGTGLIGGQWLMRLLSDYQRPDLAYQIATQETYPSWGYMVKNGATTIWELWNGNTADPAMNSGNHLMLVGDLNIWFHEYLAGIQTDPTRPAFKHIVMKPHPVGDLSYVKANYNSMHGEIRSHWTVQDTQFHWSVTIPANTSATLYLPATSPDSVTEGGQPLANAKGVSDVRHEGDRIVCTIQSGTYEFTTNTIGK